MNERRARGQALVETAISIVVLLLLTFSVVDAALLFFAYLTLQNGVTEATRIGVTGQEVSDPNSPDAESRREAKVRQIVHQSTPGLGIDDSEVSFYDVTDGSRTMGAPNHVIQITVTHPWRLLSPLVWPLVGNGGRITLRVSATMRNEPFPTGTTLPVT